MIFKVKKIVVLVLRLVIFESHNYIRLVSSQQQACILVHVVHVCILSIEVHFNMSCSNSRLSKAQAHITIGSTWSPHNVNTFHMMMQGGDSEGYISIKQNGCVPLSKKKKKSWYLQTQVFNLH
jgi:hypothetical protein